MNPIIGGNLNFPKAKPKTGGMSKHPSKHTAISQSLPIKLHIQLAHQPYIAMYWLLDLCIHNILLNFN
ncbi:MAG: hypothetical protein E6Q33_01465 [Neisseriales bacterium]|nr:MAG: hypothetical protein E6Q33_01465 [Neisseriales bacterium]